MLIVAQNLHMSTRKTDINKLQFFTVQELSRRWARHPRTIRETIKAGALRTVRIGKRNVIPMSEIERIERELAAS